MTGIDRRFFLKTATVLSASSALAPVDLLADEKKSTIIVVHGTDIGKMLGAGIGKLGGWKAFVKAGKKVTLKPNIAWSSKPETGANTVPALVGECVAACKAAGASEVVVPENGVSSSKKAFALSGIEKAVTKAGGRIYSANRKKHFREVPLKDGKKLKEIDVAVDVLDTECLINMPVAKSHGASVLTLSMKNWMGSIRNRKVMHIKGIDQCIADLNTFFKPHLIIIDATRIMTTNGPRGPGVVEYPKQLIFGKDPVAVDAYAATLFKLKPFDVPHIEIAHKMNIGCGDLDRINVVHIETEKGI